MNLPRPLLFIGNDPLLAYLLKRYAVQSGCQMILRDSFPEPGEIGKLRPIAIIFASIERLQAGQSLMDTLSTYEIPVLVCASLADEAYASELGADACLYHPLTYDGFWAVLSAVCPPEKN
jgi:hypothetical protein